jgi:hypothetical protein
MKEYPRIKSTKPLNSNKLGIMPVGNIMFFEVNKSVKKPLLLHIDIQSL